MIESGARTDQRHDERHDERHEDRDDERADVSFRALANPTRRRLLTLVRDRARPVGELADLVDVSQPATSQHLAVLRDAGLVEVHADGRRRLYRADLAALAAVRDFLEDYWSGHLDRLAAAAEDAEAAIRREVAS